MLLRLEVPLDSKSMEIGYKNHETKCSKAKFSAFIRLEDLFSKISIH